MVLVHSFLRKVAREEDNVLNISLKGWLPVCNLSFSRGFNPCCFSMFALRSHIVKECPIG